MIDITMAWEGVSGTAQPKLFVGISKRRAR